MNRVTLFLVVIVASLIVGGFIGWHLHKARTTPTVDPTEVARVAQGHIRAANARADSILAAWDVPSEPIYIRVHDRTNDLAAADTSVLYGILDADPSAE